MTPGVNEKQLIDCRCKGTCTGSFRLNVRGQTTAPIPYDATAELVKYRLEVGGWVGLLVMVVVVVVIRDVDKVIIGNRLTFLNIQTFGLSGYLTGVIDR